MSDDKLQPVTTDPDGSPFAEVGQMVKEQDSEAVQYAVEFLKKVLRIRGVRIDRADFLRQEFRKIHVDDDQIARAIESTPIQAGIELSTLDSVGVSVIAFETNKSAAMSFAAGLPGGLAMIASVPGDVTQYYAHAFRVMQKLAYLYGWQNFLGDLDDVDDETLGKFSLFLGVMMGVSGASVGLTSFVSQVARPAIQKQISKQALTKTAWYGPMKQVLRMVGVKVTKDSFAKTVTKAVPVAGGVISGSMTFVSLRLQSERLQMHLRELPPPGVDAAEYRAAVLTADVAGGSVGRTTAARSAVTKAVTSSIESVNEAAGGARGAVVGAAGRVKDRTGSLVERARRRKAKENDATVPVVVEPGGTDTEAPTSPEPEDQSGERDN